jgi:GNAT superfamily N-acetyltransferase
MWMQYIVGAIILMMDNKKVGQLEYEENRIIFLHVEKDYRSRGYGSLLLDQYANLIKDKGIQNIQVTSATTSTGFYRKNGFVSVAEYRALSWTNWLTPVFRHVNMIKAL